jgi:hypothetical protein
MARRQVGHQSFPEFAEPAVEIPATCDDRRYHPVPSAANKIPDSTITTSGLSKISSVSEAPLGVAMAGAGTDVASTLPPRKFAANRHSAISQPDAGVFCIVDEPACVESTEHLSDCRGRHIQTVAERTR